MTKASLCLVRGFGSDAGTCEFEEGDICILERDLSGRIVGKDRRKAKQMVFEVT